MTRDAALSPVPLTQAVIDERKRILVLHFGSLEAARTFIPSDPVFTWKENPNAPS